LGGDWRRGLSLLLVLATTGLACRPASDFDLVMQDSAMEPTFEARAVVHFRRAAAAERGEVIAFEYPFPYPGQPLRALIGRVIGLPGDRLSLGPDGVVRNGQRLDEPYAKNQAANSVAELTVPPDSYFVLGDDRANQRDSRWWGPLPRAKVLGVLEEGR
jgi:signal peptidase I